jgi:hypothetical protein
MPQESMSKVSKRYQNNSNNAEARSIVEQGERKEKNVMFVFRSASGAL